jgi:hypothetical protein
MDLNRSSIMDVLSQVELFEEETAFVDDPIRPMPEKILSPRSGLIEHAVMEQIERIDTIQGKVSYESLNRSLAHKMSSINNTIELCLKNANERL